VRRVGRSFGLWPAPSHAARHLGRDAADGDASHEDVVRLTVATGPLGRHIRLFRHRRQCVRLDGGNVGEQLVVREAGVTHCLGNLGLVARTVGGAVLVVDEFLVVDVEPCQHGSTVADCVDGAVVVEVRHPNLMPAAVAVGTLRVEVALHAPHFHERAHGDVDLATHARLEAETGRELVFLIAAERHLHLALADETVKHLALKARKAVVADLFGGVDLHAYHDGCHVFLLIVWCEPIIVGRDFALHRLASAGTTICRTKNASR